MSVKSATIIAGGTATENVVLERLKDLVRIETPAVLVGTSITLHGSTDSDIAGSGTYKPVYNGATLYSLTVGTSRSIVIPPEICKGLTAIRITSSANETTGAIFTLVFG